MFFLKLYVICSSRIFQCLKRFSNDNFASPLEKQCNNCGFSDVEFNSFSCWQNKSFQKVQLELSKRSWATFVEFEQLNMNCETLIWIFLFHFVVIWSFRSFLPAGFSEQLFDSLISSYTSQYFLSPCLSSTA